MSNRSAKLLLEVYDGLLFAQKSGMLNKLDGGYHTILVRPGLAETILQWAKGYLDRQKNLYHIKMGLQKKELEAYPEKLRAACEKLDKLEGQQLGDPSEFVEPPSEPSGSVATKGSPEEEINKMLVYLLNSPTWGYKK